MTMKPTTIALAAGATVAGAAVGVAAWMRHQAAAALPAPTPNLALSVPGFTVRERITGGVDPAQSLPLVLVLHGIGGSEEQLMPFTNIKAPARFVYVRGPVSDGAGPTAGYSYFKARFNTAGFMAEVEAMALQILRVLDTVASQRAISRTMLLGYSQGGHVAWMLAGSGRFDLVIPVSGALVAGYRQPPPTGRTKIEALHGADDRTLPATAGAATYRAFANAGYRGAFSRVRAGHSLTTIGKFIAPTLTGALETKPTRVGVASTQVRGR